MSKENNEGFQLKKDQTVTKVLFYKSHIFHEKRVTGILRRMEVFRYNLNIVNGIHKNKSQS